MSGLLQGGPAVLFAVIIYGIFYAIAGEQFRRVLVADESTPVRVFSGLAVIVVSAVIWVLVGTIVYWGILLWFGFLLQEPHAWRQHVLDLTAWFPCGALLSTGVFAPGIARAVAILLGYPAMLFLAALLITFWRRIRSNIAPDDATGGIIPVLTTQRMEEQQ